MWFRKIILLNKITKLCKCKLSMYKKSVYVFKKDYITSIWKARREQKVLEKRNVFYVNVEQWRSVGTKWNTCGLYIEKSEGEGGHYVTWMMGPK